MVPTEAQARCASPAPIDSAMATNGVVFVGTVVDVSQDNVATVSVESVWKGPKLAAEVLVDGGPITDPENRGLDEDERYLFFPSNDEPPFEDDRCTATRVFDDELERFKPAGAVDRPLEKKPNDNAAWTWAVAAILVGLLAIQVLRTQRRTRATRWEHQADAARRRED